MSYRYIEVNCSQSVIITSLRCISETITQMKNVQWINRSAVFGRLQHAERAVDEAMARVEQSSLMSLSDVEEMETNIQSLIQANQDLHEVLIELEKEPPGTLTFSQNGRTFTMKRTAGSYVLNWKERRRSDRNGPSTDNTGSRAFIETFSTAYKSVQKRVENESSSAFDRIKNLNSTYKSHLEKAILVRTNWERFEEKRRIEHSREERKQHVIEKGKSLGFKPQVETHGNEIIITLSKSSTSSKKSNNVGLKSRKKSGL